jgi:hypothetical protein
VVVVGSVEVVGVVVAVDEVVDVDEVVVWVAAAGLHCWLASWPTVETP